VLRLRATQEVSKTVPQLLCKRKRGDKWNKRVKRRGRRYYGNPDAEPAESIPLFTFWLFLRLMVRFIGVLPDSNAEVCGLRTQTQIRGII